MAACKPAGPAPISFTSQQRIDCAFNCAPDARLLKAVQAADAFANTRIIAALCLVGELGVTKISTTDANEIRDTLFQQLLCESGMLNCVDGDHRNVHTLLDALGQVLFPALLKRIGLNDGPAGFITAGGDIQAGNANALQVPRDVLAFLFVHTVIPEIGSVHTNGDREVSAAGKANTHDNFCGETHAVEEVAAIFVRAVMWGDIN